MLKNILAGLFICLGLISCSTSVRHDVRTSDTNWRSNSSLIDDHSHYGIIDTVEKIDDQNIINIRLAGGGIFSYVSSENFCYLPGQQVKLVGENGQRKLILLP